MLGITPVASADYYLRSCAGDAEVTLEAREGPDGQWRVSPADYELDAIAAQGEPLGVWAHPFRNLLGLSGEIDPHEASGEAFRILVNEMRDPTKPKVWEEDPTMAVGGAWRHPPLGADLRHFRTTAEWMRQWNEAHPDATPEQRAEEHARAQRGKRQNRTAYDLTYSLPKSWSVLHAALQREGRHDDADKILEAFRTGIEASLRQAAQEYGLSRRGVSGPKIDGEATTNFVRTPDLTSAIFLHHTSRDRDPQIHAHVMVLNRVLCDDGIWRALHAQPLMRAKHQLDATMLRVAEGELTRLLGIRFAARPDGKAREIVGVGEKVRELFSSRSRALSEEAQQLEDTYRKLHPDRKLRPLLRWRMNQQANRKTRKAKPDEAPTREQDLAGWEQRVAREFREGMRSVVDAVDANRALEGEPIVVEPLEADRVIAMALADVQGRKANWYRSHLYKAIADRAPDMLAIEPARVPELLTQLTDRALAEREVVRISAPTVGRVPDSLLDGQTGRSVFTFGQRYRYTTTEHLAREDSLVARLDKRGATVIPEGTARVLLEPHGLSEEQTELAIALLTSDRWLEVVNAAAGVGKSRVMAALSDVSAQVWGRGLVGFTTAENAAQVLAQEGIERAHNIAAYLDYTDRATRGEVSDVERALFTLPAGATVVVDEASMVDTRTLQSLVEAVEEAGGGRVILIGDTQQVDAVDAGGVFSLLVDKGEARTLEAVRRFRYAWERDASTRIRVGDVSALTQYDARKRIAGDIDSDKLRDRMVKAWAADYIGARRDTVLIASSTDAAADLASRARRTLVEAGIVEAGGVDLHDKTVAGLGDLVQTRHNRRDLGVYNRQVWEVVGRTSDGGLSVCRAADRRMPGADGEPVAAAPVLELPAAYVKAWVELAYAGSVEAVQGRTTDTAHLLVDRMMALSRAYPGLTRGQLANYAWIELESHRDPETGQIVPTETPVGRLADVIADDDHVRSARAAIEAELDRSDNLGHLGPQWQTLITEERDAVHRDLLRTVLEPADVAAVLADDKVRDVYHVLRAAEVAGHDARQVLESVAQNGPVWSAATPAGALRARIDEVLNAQPVGPRDIPTTYADRVPAGSDEWTVHAREIAEGMDGRVLALGPRVADEVPQWALDCLGAVPDQPFDRLEWENKAAKVEAYREQFGWNGRRSAIGPRPSRHEPDRRWVWDRAADAIGMDQVARELSALPEGELQRRVQDWERALAEMPRNVDDDLREAHAIRLDAAQRVVDAYTREQDPTEIEGDLEALDGLVETLEEIAEGRARTYEDTEELRVRGEEARRELNHREDVERARTGQAHREDPGPEEPDEPEEPEPDLDWADEDVEAAAPSFGPSIEEPEPEPEVDVVGLRAVLDRVREQAATVAGREVPAFGSREWTELADDDPAKAAAVTEAARRWHNLGEPLDRDADEVSDRLAEHEVALEPAWDGYVELREAPRREDQTRQERDTEVVEQHRWPVDQGPEVDVDALEGVRAWREQRALEPGRAVPEWGTAGWAELDPADPAYVEAEARAALSWWNAGDPLDERRERLEAWDERQASKAIADAERQRREDAHAERVRLDREARARDRELDAATPRKAEVTEEERAVDDVAGAELEYRDPDTSPTRREIARLWLESQGADLERIEADRVAALEQREAQRQAAAREAQRGSTAERDYLDPDASETTREIARLYLESQGVDVDVLAAEPEPEPAAVVEWPEVARVPVAELADEHDDERDEHDAEPVDDEPAANMPADMPAPDVPDEEPEPAEAEPEPVTAEEPEPAAEPEPDTDAEEQRRSDELRRHLVREAHADEQRRAEQERRDAEEQAAREAAERDDAARRADEERTAAEAREAAEAGAAATAETAEAEAADAAARERDAEATREADLREQLERARAATARLEAREAAERDARARDDDARRAREAEQSRERDAELAGGSEDY